MAEFQYYFAQREALETIIYLYDVVGVKDKFDLMRFDGSGVVSAGIMFDETWTGDYIFENEWQSFRTKKDRSLELTSVFHECEPGRRKLAVKVVDIFGNDMMTIVEVTVGGKK